MKTLRLESPETFVLQDASEPSQPASHEAQVRVKAIGVCGTDIHFYRGSYAFGQYPRILGHELGVEIVKLGSAVDGLAEGDLCSVEPYLNCGSCASCLAGATNRCESLEVLGVHVDGGMRELINVPIDKLRLSRSASPEQLALVEMLGVGKHAVDRVAVEKGQTVAALGMGPIGLASALFAKLQGARVVGVDVSEARAKRARELLDIEILILDTKATLEEQWLDREGQRPPIVIDATGNARSMEAAFELPGHGGKLGFVGLIQGAVPFPVPSMHRREMTTLNSRNCMGRDFEEIIALMESGRIDVRPWISHRCALEELPEVFDGWLEPGSGLVKGVVTVG